jgi:hypothetical protein
MMAQTNSVVLAVTHHVTIAVTINRLQGGMWTFAEAFHWSVWITLGGTALAVAVLITAAELLTFGNKANRKGLKGWGWYSVAKMVQVGSLSYMESSCMLLAC